MYYKTIIENSIIFKNEYKLLVKELSQKKSYRNFVKNILDKNKFEFSNYKCIGYFIKIINKQYEDIEITELNVLQIVKLIDYYDIANLNDFLNYIIEKYIFNYVFYDKLHNFKKINLLIINIIENNIIDSYKYYNKFDDIINYIYNIDKYIFENVKKIDTTYYNMSQKSILKFTNLQRLNLILNNKITNINHLSNTLIELNLCRNNVIVQYEIKYLKKLRTLNLSNNKNIININCLANTLIELDISQNNTIKEKDIKYLKILKKINTFDNLNIKKINFLTNTLVDLDTSMNCEIKRYKILRKLTIWNNTNITNINLLSKTLLEYSEVNDMITQHKINKLKILCKLNIDDNFKITNINHLTNTLIVLNSFRQNYITQKGIKYLKILQILYASNNQKITNANHLTNTLIKLYASYKSGITQNGIKDLKKLKTLYADSNSKIKSKL